MNTIASQEYGSYGPTTVPASATTVAMPKALRRETTRLQSANDNEDATAMVRIANGLYAIHAGSPMTLANRPPSQNQPAG